MAEATTETTLPRTLYGLSSCDTVKMACARLDAHGVTYAFHNVKTQGVRPHDLADWVRAVG